MTPKQAEKIRIQNGMDKGTKLRRMRVKTGYSQTELSALSGVPLKTLQRYEQNGQPLNNAKLKTLISLCFVLGCKIEDIIESEELLAKYKRTK